VTRRPFAPIVLGIALCGAAAAASAQFVELSRCQSAMPCAIPFGLRYNPDPLSVSGFNALPHTAFSMRIDPAHPLNPPKVDLSRALDSQDWARQAATIFVLKYPLKPKPVAETVPLTPTPQPQSKN
jgi:hypothetical protein